MSSFLNDKNRLNLQEMVKAYDSEDNTVKIRSLRHSQRIKDDVERLLNLKKKYNRMQKTDYKKYERLIISHCNFLWNNYTNIFNRILKDELNVNILFKFLEKLREVEDQKLDQNEASVEVGQLLKELYIDSALQRSKKIEQHDKKTTSKERTPIHNISWASYKRAYPSKAKMEES